jgi:hypothetical protein
MALAFASGCSAERDEEATVPDVETSREQVESSCQAIEDLGCSPYRDSEHCVEEAEQDRVGAAWLDCEPAFALLVRCFSEYGAACDGAGDFRWSPRCDGERGALEDCVRDGVPVCALSMSGPSPIFLTRCELSCEGFGAACDLDDPDVACRCTEGENSGRALQAYQCSNPLALWVEAEQACP